MHGDDALRCPECDYNLTGLPDDRCPECGTSFDRRNLQANYVRVHPLWVAAAAFWPLLAFLLAPLSGFFGVGCALFAVLLITPLANLVMIAHLNRDPRTRRRYLGFRSTLGVWSSIALATGLTLSQLILGGLVLIGEMIVMTSVFGWR